MTRAKSDSMAVLARRKARRGAAFLMLVVMVVIVVLGATRSLLKNEIGANRASQQRIRHEIMLTAIERSRDVGLSNQLRSFPIDQAGEERIEVSLNQASGVRLGGLHFRLVGLCTIQRFTAKKFEFKRRVREAGFIHPAGSIRDRLRI